MDVKVIISRLRQITKCKTNTDLARWLNVSDSTLSMWQHRNSANLDIIVAKCIEHNISVDWIIGINSDTTRLIDVIINQQQTIYNLSSVKRKQKSNGDKA